SFSKSLTSAPQSMSWTTSDTRYELAALYGTQELSPTDSLILDDSILDEQVHLSDDEDSRNDHLPNVDSRKDWWKPLPAEERPVTLEPTWTVPSSNVSDTNPEGDQVRINVNRPLPLDGPPSHVTIQSQFLFNKDLEYLRHGSKGSSPALSISKMKAPSYPDFGLELLVPKHMWIEDVCTYDISAKYGISHWWFNRQKFYIDRHDSPSRHKEVRSHMRILSVVRIKAYSRYGYDYLSEIVLRRADLQEHTIAEKYFKNLHPGDFEDLNLLLLQGHPSYLSSSDKKMLSTAVKLWTRNLVIRQRVEYFQLGIKSYQTQLNLTKPGWDAAGYEFKHDYTIIESPRAVVFPVNNNERKIMRFNEIYTFSNGTLTRILLAYRVKEFKIKRLNPGMKTHFWTQKDLTRSKEFIAAIERRLKTRRIYRNLECFESDSGRFQPLPEVQGKGKGKEKVVEEQAAYDLLTLQTPKNKSHVDQFIFQRRTPMPAEAFKPAESPILDAKLALIDSETGSDDDMPKIKMKARLDQILVYKMKVRMNQTWCKTNVEAKVQSMVLVPIHQDISLVPSMTTPVIDLTTSQSGSPLPTSSATTSTTRTITTIPTSPPQPQQSTANPTLMKHIDELEQHMANLLQYNLALEKRLDKHGSRLYKLENLNIPHQVSKAVNEIVTDAVDCAMQAPLRSRFSDLPAVDMKEILQQRMFEDKSYEAHKDHKKLYDVLEKSLECDYSGQLLLDLEEARQKKRKRRDVLRTPSGSPPPLPPPPPTGASGALVLQEHHDLLSFLHLLLLLHLLVHLDLLSNRAVKLQVLGLYGTQELSPMDFLILDDSIPDEHVHLSDDEDSRNDHLPTADSRKGWWKPLPTEERPATPEPTWTILSSNVSDVENN
nr:hypothetical protein [Tanacetum cinerariifolium]